MESVFFDSNPSIRQFTDNAQRANALLHRTQQKEMKTKTSKTTQTDSADMSSGTDVSSGDMLGGMDFGDNRGSGGDFEFTSYEQSEERKEQLRESARKYGEEQREILEQEKRMSDFIKALKGEETKTVHEPQALPVNPPASSVNEEEVAVISEETEFFEDTSATETLQNISAPPEAQVVVPDVAAPIKDVLPKEKRHIEPVENKHNVESVAKPLVKPDEKAEKIDISVTKKAKPPIQEDVKKDSGWNSLLSFDDGFLIANFASQTAEIADEKEMILDFSGEKIEIPQTLDEITADIEEIISDMLISAPSNEQIKSILNYQLSPFGKRILKLCHDFGVKIKLKNSSLKDSFPNENFSANSACAYMSAKKLCILDENVIIQKEEAMSTRLFMAMAFDHALGIDTFSSLKSPAVLSNYGLCQESEPGHLFCDSFASENPINYFAQAIESFLRKGDETLDSHLYNHEELYDYDRSMYMYIDYLFKEMNRSH